MVASRPFRRLPGSTAALGWIAVLATITAALPVSAQGRGGSPVVFDLQARRLGGMRAQVATLLVQGGRGGAIATEVLATPVDMPGEAPGERLVPVLIEIEGPSLLSARGDDAEGDRQRVEIYVYALTPQGAVSDYITQTLRLDLEKLGEQIYAGGLKFVGSLSLPPGRYSLRSLILDVGSGQFGLRTVPLAVPSPDLSVSMLMAPLVAEPAESWLLVRQDVTPETPSAAPAGEEAEVSAAASTPLPITPEQAVSSLLVGDDRSLPSAFPLFDSGATVEVHLLAYGLGKREPRVSAKLFPQEGGDPLVIPVEVLTRQDTEDPEMDRLTGRFSVPDLSTGAFLLSFQAELPQGATESGQIRALVLEDNPLGRQLAWGQLRSAAAELQQTGGAASAAPRELDLPRRRKKRVAALAKVARERYARVLAAIGSGSSAEEVVESLAAMERNLAKADPVEGLPALQKGERMLADQVAAAEPEALVPLISFHLDLYLLYRETREFALATHSRQLTSDLAELYANTRQTDSARTIASQALTSLATEMLDAGLRNSGGLALEEALKLDEHNDAARLQLAAHYERLGNYGPAVETLRKLVQFNPKSAEGRLRLALNLRRTGDVRQAAQELHELVSESNPPWTLTVAYTELANLYLDQHREGAAVTLLRHAVDRLPDQDRLYIQLAYALDRQRQFLEARRVLARLAARDHHLNNGGPSPRHRYAKGTSFDLRKARDQVTNAARTRQPLLATVLDRLATSTS
jgi:tetratricopeptide (TPR) repeat protein